MKTKHRIIRCISDRDAEKHLDEMVNDDWFIKKYFFIDNTHLMVFEKIESLEAVTTYTQLEFAEN